MRVADYSVGYRHPAVLANAIATIDHLSGGRADIGLGAGWSEIEYLAYGIPFPRVRVLLDQLEEAIQCVRGLLLRSGHQLQGRAVRYARRGGCESEARATCFADLDRWSRREAHVRIAAEWADGWNLPFVDRRSHTSVAC